MSNNGVNNGNKNEHKINVRNTIKKTPGPGRNPSHGAYKFRDTGILPPDNEDLGKIRKALGEKGAAELGSALSGALTGADEDPLLVDRQGTFV